MIDFGALSNRIAETRIDLGMTQAELAQKAGLSRQSIWRIENGGAGSMSAEGLARVLAAIGYDMRVELGFEVQRTPDKPNVVQYLNERYYGGKL